MVSIDIGNIGATLPRKMAAVRLQATHEPFLKHLNVQRTPHVVVTAEDEDFDEEVLRQLTGEGFNVRYVAMNDDGAVRYAERLHEVADRMTGVNEHYGIVAYGDAASVVLETHTKAPPRLCAIVAYYPGAIPDPSRTTWPMNVEVLMHLAGGEIGVRRNPEILGIQGKRKTVRKRMARGLGVGGEMKLGCLSYKYEGVEPGFAEHDLEDYDGVAAELAWSRTLRTLREAFAIKVDVEGLRDEHVESRFPLPSRLARADRPDVRSGNVGKALEMSSSRAKVIFAPTMTGAISAKDLERFYSEFFSPSPAQLGARLLSRTIGVDRVVDEIELSFEHDTEIPWLLPGVPPTHKQVDVVMVSIVCVKAGLLGHEHVYWDQASVLLQVGLLDAEAVPQKFKDKGVEVLPVVGAESARAIRGEKEEMNELIEEW